MILHLPPWLFALAVIYAVSLTWIFGVLLLGDIQRRRRARVRRPGPLVVDLHSSSDAAIRAVAEEGLDAAPELADDAEATARTVLALEDVARLRALAARDAGQVAKHDVLLVEIYKAQAYSRFGDDITKDAPKERP
jgi:hypothetical protein